MLNDLVCVCLRRTTQLQRGPVDMLNRRGMSWLTRSPAVLLESQYEHVVFPNFILIISQVLCAPRGSNDLFYSLTIAVNQ